jgi:hypothetical protein
MGRVQYSKVIDIFIIVKGQNNRLQGGIYPSWIEKSPAAPGTRGTPRTPYYAFPLSGIFEVVIVHSK